MLTLVVSQSLAVVLTAALFLSLWAEGVILYKIWGKMEFKKAVALKERQTLALSSINLRLIKFIIRVKQTRALERDSQRDRIQNKKISIELL